MEPFTTWLVDFWGSKLPNREKGSLANQGIAVLSPGLAAISRPARNSLDPRHQAAWVEARTRSEAVAKVVRALAPIGAYGHFTASRA
jgi:hypothetical protein